MRGERAAVTRRRTLPLQHPRAVRRRCAPSGGGGAAPRPTQQRECGLTGAPAGPGRPARVNERGTGTLTGIDASESPGIASESPGIASDLPGSRPSRRESRPSRRDRVRVAGIASESPWDRRAAVGSRRRWLRVRSLTGPGAVGRLGHVPSDSRAGPRRL